MSPPRSQSPPRELVTHLAYRARATLLLFDAPTAPAVWRLPEDLRAAAWCSYSEVGRDLWGSLPVTPGFVIASVERCLLGELSAAAWRMMVLDGPPPSGAAAVAPEPGRRVGSFLTLQLLTFQPDCPRPLLILLGEPELRPKCGLVILDRGSGAAIPVGDLAEWARWSAAGILVTHRKTTALHANFLRPFHRVIELSAPPGTLQVTATVSDGAGCLIERLPLCLDRPGGNLIPPPRDHQDCLEWYLSGRA